MSMYTEINAVDQINKRLSQATAVVDLVAIATQKGQTAPLADASLPAAAWLLEELLEEVQKIIDTHALTARVPA